MSPAEFRSIVRAHFGASGLELRRKVIHGIAQLGLHPKNVTANQARAVIATMDRTPRPIISVGGIPIELADWVEDKMYSTIELKRR
jgi:hypothetical protein